MMNIWLWTIGSVVVISLLSVIGAVGLLLKEKALNRALIYFVSFSAGSLLGGAFFHLLPESFDLSNDAMMIFGFLVIGFCAFFVLEKVLRWRHCHDHGCHEHAHIGWMNLIGGSVHNMLDGMVIAAAFMVGPFLGVPVVISIISHEIPHELGDFGVLLYSGFSKSKALLYNFISALFCLLGAVLVLSFANSDKYLEIILLPIAAGGFIYIAASDLIPELHKETSKTHGNFSFALFLVALVMMYFLKILFE